MPEVMAANAVMTTGNARDKTTCGGICGRPNHDVTYKRVAIFWPRRNVEPAKTGPAVLVALFSNFWAWLRVCAGDRG